MRIAVGLMVASFGLISLGRAQCLVQSGVIRRHLIELYTSEGCSSCPPAERWLGSRRTDANVVALEFHVDYWDALGWRDRFADPRYTARQQALVARGGSGIVYTPEIALDGREWRDWYRGSSPPVAASAPIAFDLKVETGSPLKVSLNFASASGADASAYRAYFVLTEDGLSSDVHAGENRGVLLKHDHVVRALAGPLMLDRAQAELVLPADFDPQHAAVVAYVADTRDRSIAQAVTVPLAQCRPNDPQTVAR